MNTTEPATPPSLRPTGIFGTKIPSSVAFTVGVLLFLLPFAEVKCNGNAFANNTGLGIATGKEWNAFSDDMFGSNFMNEEKTSKIGDKKQDPNAFAIVALALGIIGFALSLINVKTATGSALVSGILSAGALIGLMIDLKQKVKIPLAQKTDNSFENFGNNMMRVTIEFTPWFYIAIIAFVIAAFFCYKRIQSSKQ